MGLEDRIDRPRTVSQKDSPSRGFVFRIEWGMFLKKKKLRKKVSREKGEILYSHAVPTRNVSQAWKEGKMSAVGG